MAQNNDAFLLALLRQTGLFNDVQMDQLASADRSADASVTTPRPAVPKTS